MSEPATWVVADPLVERIDLDERCWVDVVRGIVPASAADSVHDELAANVAWQQGRVFRYERYIDEPRLGGWQAGDDRHPALVEVQDWISHRYRVRFDGVALAQYRDERDSVAWHRDPRAQVARRDGDRGVHHGRPPTVDGPAADWPSSGPGGRRPLRCDRPRAGQRRSARARRRLPAGVAPRRAQGAGPHPQPHLGPVAMDVAARSPRHEPVLLRAPALQPVASRRSPADPSARLRQPAAPPGRRGPWPIE